MLEQTLRALRDTTSDATFVHEFISRNGLTLATSIIESGSFQLSLIYVELGDREKKDDSNQPIAMFWTSFWQLMENSGASWNNASEALIGQARALM